MALFSFGGYVSDDEGKRVKLLDPAGMSEWPGKGDSRITELVTRLRRVISQASAAASATALLLGIVIWFSYASVIPTINQILPRLPGFVHLIVIILLVRLMLGLLWRIGLSLRRNQVASLILTEGLCPCCGYNFAGLRLEEREAGKILNCPECGSAWRASRIVRLQAFDPSLPLVLPTGLVKKRIKLPRWSVVDDRGVPVGLVYPSLGDPMLREGDPSVLSRLRRARRVIGRSGMWVRAPLSALMALLGLYFFVLAMIEPQPEMVALIAVGGVVCLGISVAMYLGNFLYRPAHVRTAMLDEGLCPGCGGDLRAGLTPHVDGCVECGKCHAAWRVAPPTEAP
jgi:hypothetical protein